MSKPISFCKVEGCEKRCFGQGFCSKHYARLLRGRNPFLKTRREPNEIVIIEDIAEIVLRDKNMKEVARATVDIDDLPKLAEYIWSHGNTSGYAYSHTAGPTVMMHKLIAETPIGMLTDHINCNKLDNRKQNLRWVNDTQNSQNMTPWKKDNKHSNYKGVCILMNKKYTLKKPWISYIGVNGKRHYLGYYATQEDAAIAYDKAAKEHFGEFARLNFPELSSNSV